jgi:Ni/Fe-hydrogenase subunit HybB-like protein
MSALQGLALFWAGQKDRRNYFIHAGLGIFWALASGIAQLPVILTTSDYRSGFMSLAYVVGMIAIGILLFVTSLQALRISGKPQVKNAVE